MKTIIVKFIDNNKVIFNDTYLNISKSFDRYIPFQNITDIFEWIRCCLTDKYSCFITHFQSIDYGEKETITGFCCSFSIPDYINIK